MAKLKGPLFSFGARGQLGEALVYFPWKGIHCVRTYVVPANPNTSDQQTQRTLFEGAVDDWHDVALDADDVAAWKRRAAVKPSPMSGFNAFVGEHVDIGVAGETPNMGYDGGLTDDADHTFSGSIEEDGTADAVDMEWGTSPTALINTSAGAETTDVWACTPTDVVTGQTIYARFVLKAAAAVIGTTGIFTVKVA